MVRLSMTGMLSLNEPRDFTADFNVVGCLCVYDGRVLLLQRGPHRSHPGKWGSPGGKIRPGEAPVRAALRELHEETGIVLSEDNLVHAHCYFVTDTTFRFAYDLFIAEFDGPREVILNAHEHTDSRWVLVADALHLALVPYHDLILIDQRSRLGEEHAQFDLFGRPHGPARSKIEDIEAECRKTLGPRGDLVSIEIARPWYVALGPPASGKSTSLQAMKRWNPKLQILRERQLVRANSRMNQMLRSATDLQQHHPYFHFQMTVLPIRLSQLLSGRRTMTAVLDDSHYSALAYSKALYELKLLDEHEYSTFYLAFCLGVQLLGAPTAAFYFDCPTDVLMTRIRARATASGQERAHELQYSLEYVAALARAFDVVARELEQSTIVVHIDTGTQTPDDIAQTYTPT